MKVLKFFKKDIFKEMGIVLTFLLLFLLLNWRLFAIGSENQLFLYGDNLSSLNNLFYLFSHFDFWHPFATLIGQNGMLGSYPMAEPQNSIFYLPITLAFLGYKIFHLHAVGLYYELLVMHTIHFLIGVYCIYKISHRFLNTSRSLSIIAGIVYLGLGWNAAWFGTATLSYMIGILPLVFYLFFQYLRIKTVRTYIIFVLSLALFLYAGGIVNFFFYLFLNFVLLFTAFVFLKYDQFFTYASKKEVIKQYILLFIVAPLLSLLVYSVQLFSTYQVSADVTHSSSSYDYLAFFGTHFYDLIGVIVPNFGLVDFSSSTVPRFIANFLLTNSLYIGFLPLVIIAFGILAIKNKSLTLFASLLAINAILCFGGAFPFYDVTYFFPGNSFFRGHYKYLMFVGIYLSLMIPIVLHAIQQREFEFKKVKTISRLVTRYLVLLLVLGILCSFSAFALKAFEKGNPVFSSSYYTIAITFTNYFFRMIFIGIISFVVLRVVMKHPRGTALLAFALILLVDTSVNYKYGLYYGTKIQDLVSDTFFKQIEGKTIINDIDAYSQLYQIPEIVGADPLFFYSAIPNRYLVDYSGQIRTPSGGFRKEVMKAAGIDGIITTNAINDADFQQESSTAINTENYKQLYVYNADGSIHNDWGSQQGLIKGTISFYSLQGVKKAFFSSDYREETKDQDVLDDLAKDDFSSTEPIVLVDSKDEERDSKREKVVTDVSFLDQTPTYKKIFLNNKDGAGLFYVNIPYSSMWKAKVNGIESKIYRANGAFSAVKITDTNATVELYVDTHKHIVLLWISISSVFLLILSLIVPFGRLRWAYKKAVV
jgi:hypothetical protein